MSAGRRLPPLLLVLLLAVTACGGQPELAASAAEDLQQRVAELRAAAETQQVEEATAALERVRRGVRRWRGRDAVSAARARRILNAADAVERQLAALRPSPPAPPTSPPTEPSRGPTEPEQPPPEDEEGEGAGDEDEDESGTKRRGKGEDESGSKGKDEGPEKEPKEPKDDGHGEDD